MLTSKLTPDGSMIVTAQGETCFYCHHPTEDPAIIWMGVPEPIFLHPDCVLQLVVRLCRDYHEWCIQPGR